MPEVQRVTDFSDKNERRAGEHVSVQKRALSCENDADSAQGRWYGPPARKLV